MRPRQLSRQGEPRMRLPRWHTARAERRVPVQRGIAACLSRLPTDASPLFTFTPSSHSRFSIAEVDELLRKAGVADAASLHSALPTDGDTEAAPAEGGADPTDADALYERALELYGVNADAEAVQAKMQGIRERTKARRAEMQGQLLLS